MPLYEIKCTKCEYKEEIRCSFDDLKTKTCPLCKSEIIQIPGKLNWQMTGFSMENGYSDHNFCA